MRNVGQRQCYAFDLAGSEEVKSVHLQEALSYRNLDRDNWAK